MRSAATATQDLGVLLRDHHPALRRRLLKTWTRGGTTLTPARKRLFEALSNALDREYYDPGTDTERREEIKRLCMGEDCGVEWARIYLARGFPDRFTPVLGMFAELERRLASGRVGSVHQVACCSGREIAHYARLHPGVRFRGSDADPAVVEFLREEWRRLPNLGFEVLRLERPDDAGFAALESDLTYASGGLHYLDPASLRRFLSRARDLTAALLLSQPLDAGYAPDREPASMPRRMLSWNHPYPALLAEAGWQEVGWSESSVAELPGVKNLAAWGEGGRPPEPGQPDRETGGSR